MIQGRRHWHPLQAEPRAMACGSNPRPLPGLGVMRIPKPYTRKQAWNFILTVICFQCFLGDLTLAYEMANGQIPRVLGLRASNSIP